MIDALIIICVITFNTLVLIYALWLFSQKLEKPKKNLRLMPFMQYLPPRKMSEAEKELKAVKQRNEIEKLLSLEAEEAL